MYHIILNPVAAGGTAHREINKIELLLKQYNISYKLHKTEYKGHAVELVRHLIVEEDARFIAAAGGDGTINEVINGIFSQKTVPTTSITFAVIPIGTGNDFIRTQGIPHDIAKAINILAAGRSVLHSIGKLNFTNIAGQQETRFFANVAGFAYDAYACERLHLFKNTFLPPKLFYLYVIFKCLFGYEPERVRVTLDGKEVLDEEIYTVNVGICKYSGGGAIFVPQADPTSDTFGVTIVRKVSKLNVIKSTPMFYNGKIITHPQASAHHAKHIRIEGVNAPTRAETDGEYLGVSPVTIEILAQALRVVVRGF